MRYVKVLLFVLIFFVSMVFFFQNQTTLSTEMKLQLQLFFVEPMESIALPFYFLVLAAFLLGAILAVCALVWDKMSLSARLMKSQWRVRSLEKEVATLKAKQVQQELPAVEVPAETKGKKEAEKPVEAPKKEEKEEPRQRVTSATPEDFA